MALLVKTKLVHPASLYSVKLIVPVGLVPRVRCATSETCPPAVACGVALVVTVGEALLTTLVSFGALHAVVKPLLRSEEHTSELQSLAYLVCRLLLEKKKMPRTVRADHPAILPIADAIRSVTT